MTKTSELAHLFRALKAPAAARALPTLAERAGAESWGYERFAEALLSAEVASRESHGGEGRIKRARFPARKTLEQFDFTFQRSVKAPDPSITSASSTSCTRARTSSCSARPGPGKVISQQRSGSAPASPGKGSSSPPPPWVARLGDAKRHAALEAELRRLSL